MSWIKFIKRIQKEYELENDAYIGNFNYNDLLNFKYNLDSKLDDICLKNTDQNIIHITFNLIDGKTKMTIKPKMYNLDSKNKCPIYIYFPEYGFKIKDESDKYLEIKSSNLQHIAVIILEKSKKEVTLYDSYQKNKDDENVTKMLLGKILNESFDDYKFNRNSTLAEKLEKQCVPNVFMFTYLNLKYNTNVEEFSEYMENMSCGEKYKLNMKFQKFLNN